MLLALCVVLPDGPADPLTVAALCGVWRQVRELDSPESLLAVDCDPFRLI